MTDRTITLDVAREGTKVKVSLFEGNEKTLRPYEIFDVDWRQVDLGCREILALFKRSNGNSQADAELLQNLSKTGRLLFELLIPPQARQKLADTGAESLVLRLEDTLIQVPWELLHDGREFLCRRFSVGRIASTRQTPTARSVRAARVPFKALIIADPRGDLEASYREGLDIKAFLDQRRESFHVDFKSYPVDIAFVKKNLRDYDIVHYAGHAEYDARNPSDSGWLLSDGTLKAGEITGMGGHQPMPALVFSNACQSGLTDGWVVDDQEERIFGLANAFLLSGVQHYIGTFWKTVDEPSANFAKCFYATVAEGKSIGSALRDARHAPSDGGERETLTWANYMLYGDPSREFAAALNETQSRRGGTQLLNGLLPSAAEEQRPAKSPLQYSLIAASLLIAAYGGYSVYRSGGTWRGNAVSQEKPASQFSVAVTPAIEAEVPLSLSMNVMGQRKEPDGSYTEVIVREGSVLQSRDHFQVHVETNKPSHVYVLLFDSQGQATQLFPDPKIEYPGFFDSGRKVAVPDKELWFWLDENPGTETVYVLASEEPMSDIRGLLSKMDKAGNAERKRLSGQIRQQIQIVERGVGGVAKGKTVSYPLSDGRLVQKVTDVVAGSGAVVRAISFEHR